MSLNNRQMFEALLAGETLRDTENPDITLYLYNDVLVSDDSSPIGNLCLHNWELQPKVININGYEVPEPVRKPLQNGTTYHTVSMSGALCIDSYIWSGDSYDRNHLDHGLIHLTEEAAELHRAALLSFTSTKPQP
jgi:hypothetical protein